MMSLGTKAPDFALNNTLDSKTVRLEDFKGKKGVLVFFICNHCPYVIHIRDTFKSFSEEYMAKGIAIVAINANSTTTHPQDGPAEMRKLAQEKEWKFPYLFDDSQHVAKSYKAACTPDFFLFDKDFMLVYRGQFDESRPKNNMPVTGKDLRFALNALLNEKPIPPEQRPSSGCNIKWHPGKEPTYFLTNERLG